MDRRRLQQVATNLPSNATRFAPPGSSVEVAVHTRGDRLRVEVVEHGPGVRPEPGIRTFLIGTVDEFAQVPWNGATRQLFGRTMEKCDHDGCRNNDVAEMAKGALPVWMWVM